MWRDGEKEGEIGVVKDGGINREREREERRKDR